MILHDENLEQAVVGACMQNEESLVVTTSILKEVHLHSEPIKSVYKAISELFKASSKVDMFTVVQQLKKNNVFESIGGAYFVTSLTNHVVSPANIETHCRIIQQFHILRELIRLGDNVKYKANEPQADCFDVISWTNNELIRIESGIQTNSIESIEVIKNELIAEMREVVKSGKQSGILTSIDVLNNQTNGWQKSNLIVVGARPGVGKTSFALDCVLTPALKQIPCAFFSLEMKNSELAGKILSAISNMPVQKINNKRVNNYDVDLLERDGQILDGIPLYIDDKTFTLEDLKTKARKLKREKGIQLLVIDYLQLMKGEKGGNREGEISHISRSLKMLAKELDIPIMALSQLNRLSTARQSYKPMLSDLRESGAIEQDADMVVLLLRPEEFTKDNYETVSGSYNVEGLFVFIIAKFRGGATGECIARWIGETTQIVNYNF